MTQKDDWSKKKKMSIVFQFEDNGWKCRGTNMQELFQSILRQNIGSQNIGNDPLITDTFRSKDIAHLYLDAVPTNMDRTEQDRQHHETNPTLKKTIIFCLFKENPHYLQHFIKSMIHIIYMKDNKQCAYVKVQYTSHPKKWQFVFAYHSFDVITPFILQSFRIYDEQEYEHNHIHVVIKK